MELSFSDLKKREVINVAEARSLGYVTDISLSFPSGKISGITVPGRNLNCISKIFSKTKIFIPSKRIIRIGDDVILVNVNCGDTCGENVNIAPIKPPNCPPPCPPHCQPQSSGNCFPSIFGENKGEQKPNNKYDNRIDMDDY